MKVHELISALKQFPPDADCFAYEGEIVGVVINYNGYQGSILCSESGDDGDDQIITLLPNGPPTD